MKKTYHVLIIEDEPTTREGYENSLLHIQEQSDDIAFNIETAKDCPTAYDRIIQAISTKPYDLVFLDIRLPTSHGHKIRCGEDLGVMIRKEMPSAKLIVLTSHFQNAPLNAVLVKLKPDAFVFKGDIMVKDFMSLVEKVIDNKNFFSHRITTLMNQQLANKDVMDDLDVKILIEISNGAKLSELLELIPLSKSGIEKRIRNMKIKFGIPEGSNRDLVLLAREKAFV